MQDNAAHNSTEKGFHEVACLTHACLLAYLNFSIGAFSIFWVVLEN